MTWTPFENFTFILQGISHRIIDFRFLPTVGAETSRACRKCRKCDRPPNLTAIFGRQILNCVQIKKDFPIFCHGLSKLTRICHGGRARLETNLSSFHEFQSEICKILSKMLAPLACAYFVLNFRRSVMLLNNQCFKNRHGCNFKDLFVSKNFRSYKSSMCNSVK